MEVIAPASNYAGIHCEVAKSFPPEKTFTWTRKDDKNPLTDIHSIERYMFENITSDEQVSRNGRVIITEVTFEDDTVFTCKVTDLGGRLRTDVSLDVRLRVKSELLSQTSKRPCTTSPFVSVAVSSQIE